MSYYNFSFGTSNFPQIKVRVSQIITSYGRWGNTYPQNQSEMMMMNTVLSGGFTHRIPQDRSTVEEVDESSGYEGMRMYVKKNLRSVRYAFIHERMSDGPVKEVVMWRVNFWSI
jgi:hypothetical protein